MSCNLSLESNLLPPSSPYYNCSWGDGNEELNAEFDEVVNRNGDTSIGFEYHIKHKYLTPGVYDVTCTLYNMVSSQDFSKTVSYKIRYDHVFRHE